MHPDDRAPGVGALWVRENQEPNMSALRATDRRGGTYRRYFPSLLERRTTRLVAPDTMTNVADAAVAIARLGQLLRDHPTPLLYATLLRDESIASSWVEGLHETPRNIMVAQLRERDPGLVGHQFDHLGTATTILGNLDSVRQGVSSLRGTWHDDLVHSIHRLIAPQVHDGRYRAGDVQIGGASRLTAAYVAPPARLVGPLMADLLDYANLSDDNAVVKAAVLHAQFETIHPYTDGNGRAGRVLVHGYLARAGLLDSGVLPLSVVLRRDTAEYVRRLTRFRHGTPDERPEAVSQFVAYFADCLLAACDEAATVVTEAAEVHDDWVTRVARFRADAAIRRALPLLAEQPVVTARYLTTALGASPVTARSVVDHLVAVGILEPAGGRFRRAEVYQAPALLAMMDRLVPGIQPTPLPRPIARDANP